MDSMEDHSLTFGPAEDQPSYSIAPEMSSISFATSATNRSGSTANNEPFGQEVQIVNQIYKSQSANVQDSSFKKQSNRKADTYQFSAAADDDDQNYHSMRLDLLKLAQKISPRHAPSLRSQSGSLSSVGAENFANNVTLLQSSQSSSSHQIGRHIDQDFNNLDSKPSQSSSRRGSKLPIASSLLYSHHSINTNTGTGKRTCLSFGLGLSSSAHPSNDHQLSAVSSLARKISNSSLFRSQSIAGNSNLNHETSPKVLERMSSKETLLNCTKQSAVERANLIEIDDDGNDNGISFDQDSRQLQQSLNFNVSPVRASNMNCIKDSVSPAADVSLSGSECGTSELRGLQSLSYDDKDKDLDADLSAEYDRGMVMVEDEGFGSKDALAQEKVVTSSLIEEHMDEESLLAGHHSNHHERKLSLLSSISRESLRQLFQSHSNQQSTGDGSQMEQLKQMLQESQKREVQLQKTVYTLQEELLILQESIPLKFIAKNDDIVIEQQVNIPQIASWIKFVLWIVLFSMLYVVLELITVSSIIRKLEEYVNQIGIMTKYPSWTALSYDDLVQDGWIDAGYSWTEWIRRGVGYLLGNNQSLVNDDDFQSQFIDNTYEWVQ
ncbi:hypothetical protein MP228_012255 [Amoeboaphelidium protococcarum]|nr:hypothetical protein MP228_012255 [Amoeboaphelidium protococcarum]